MTKTEDIVAVMARVCRDDYTEHKFIRPKAISAKQIEAVKAAGYAITPIDGDSVTVTKERLAELEDRSRRIIAMMPVFQEARDAICAITETQRRLHNISHSLADRMDELGDADRWRTLAAAEREVT